MDEGARKAVIGRALSRPELSTASVDNPVDFSGKKHRVLRKNAEKSGEITN
jgi:hypothetical protein